MLNRSGFVPKSAPEPAFYRKSFNGWCAVYYAADDTEYHLQLEVDPWGWQDGHKHATGVSILRQHSDGRNHVYLHPFKSIKAALAKLIPLLG